MWLETVEKGFVNAEHIVRIDLDATDVEDYRTVGISVYTVTGEEIDAFSVGEYEFYFAENPPKAIQKNPWIFMDSIMKKIFEAIISGEQILTLKEVVGFAKIAEKDLEREESESL